MCGIIGIFGQEPVNQRIYDGLIMLQHRGQDGAGIATEHKGRLCLYKNHGLVSDVFRQEQMLQLEGNIGIGHVRYPTAGSSSIAEAQPFYVNSPYGIALAHNGNLVRTQALLQSLYERDRRHINTNSDSEILLNLLAHELMQQAGPQPSPDEVFAAVSQVHAHCQGGYAVVAQIIGVGLLAFRDPHGIRPLVYGERMTDAGPEYMVASESVALDTAGFRRVRDVRPGEAMMVDRKGNLHTRQCADNPSYAPCIFEYVYLARPDSMIDGVSVYKARLRMGEALAGRIRQQYPDAHIDTVIPVPDTSRPSAQALAQALAIDLREGFIKNRYIGRTFIMPGQGLRKRSVRQKLNPIDLEFRGKNVLIVDDSIVRGTTSRQIVQMARECGAKQVFMASAAPPVRYQNVYGIDMPAAEELIAHGRTEQQVAEAIGVDWLVYQDEKDLVQSVQHANPELAAFDLSCFNGKYVVGDLDESYLRAVSEARNDAAQQARRKVTR